jgi:transposase InsO family protein
VYYEPEPTSDDELALMRRIDELHLKLPFYGSRKMTVTLKAEGHTVNRKRIQRLMRQMGLEALPTTSRPGHECRGDELPTELQRAQSRLQRIRQAKAELEAEAKQARESSGPLVDDKEKDDGGSGGSSGGGAELPSHRVPTRADATPTAKAQRNFTDPDSRIMKSGNDFVQGYNAQLVVASEAQVIVAHGVGNQPPDAEYLAPMIERTITNCGRNPTRVSADAGYFSEANVTHASARGVEPFVATGRFKHGERPSCPRGRPPKGMSMKAQMARKLLTKRGRSVYARRKVIVEPVFGHIKEARGFRRFHLRGMGKVRGEWALVCIGHNLRASMPVMRRPRSRGATRISVRVSGAIFGPGMPGVGFFFRDGDWHRKDRYGLGCGGPACQGPLAAPST